MKHFKIFFAVFICFSAFTYCVNVARLLLVTGNGFHFHLTFNARIVYICCARWHTNTTKTAPFGLHLACISILSTKHIVRALSNAHIRVYIRKKTMIIKRVKHCNYFPEMRRKFLKRYIHAHKLLKTKCEWVVVFSGFVRRPLWFLAMRNGNVYKYLNIQVFNACSI